jgi:hypothetical protein
LGRNPLSRGIVTPASSICQPCNAFAGRKSEINGLDEFEQIALITSEFASLG